MIDQIAYAAFIEAVELKELHVFNVESSRKQEQVDWPLQVETKFEPGEPSVVDGKLMAYPKFTFNATPKNAEEPAVTMELVWRLAYVLEGKTVDDFEDAIVQAFFERNIPINVWPHARLMVTLLTAQMGLPPFVLETYKIIR